MLGFHFIAEDLNSLVIIDVWAMALVWYSIAMIFSYSIQYCFGRVSVKTSKWRVHAVLGFNNLLFSSSVICESGLCSSDLLVGGIAMSLTSMLFLFWVLRDATYSDDSELMTIFGLSFGLMASGVFGVSGAYVLLVIFLSVLLTHVFTKGVELVSNRTGSGPT